jgi:CheY-like chemotaxis protein
MSPDCGDSPVMLVAEDNPADVLFFEEAVEAAGLTAKLHIVGDGRDAMRFLRREGTYANAPRPDVVVLDLNLPKMNGSEVMLEMVSDPELATIPVVILTTCTPQTSMFENYPRGYCACFIKTENFEKLQDIVRQIAAHARERN